MALRFYNEHSSIDGTTEIDWKVEIWDSAFVGEEYPFNIERDSSFLQYRATGDNVFSPVLGSSFVFTMMIEDTTHEALITDMASAAEGRFTVVVYKDSVFYWAGVINSPEIIIQDFEYPYGFDISAVDGLALLKNYEYRQDGTDVTKYDLRYTGIDSLIDIVFRCLQKLPHVVTHFTGSTKFVVSAVNWYNDQHTDPATSTYDPLYYTEIDNRFAVTGQSSGNAKFLSCFDVLSGILTAFGARIMQADGYFLIEQIEHRAYTIGSNQNYSRYYAYDGTGPTANTLTADQDVGGSQTIKKMRGGTYSFAQAAKSVRAKQNVNSLINLLAGTFYDSGTVEDNTIENVFGDNEFNYIRISGSIEWSFDNVGVGAAGDTPFIARFRLKFNLGTKYANRVANYDTAGNWTFDQLTWENSLSYIEIPVKLTIPASGQTWAGQTPIDFQFPAYSGFTLEDLVVSLELIEVNYYILGAETLLDPADYDLDWSWNDPYASVVYSPKKIKLLGLPAGAVNPQDVTYEVIGNDDNTQTLEVETILGDRIGTVLNQWGGLLFNDAGTYSYTENWGARNGTRNRPITQLLAKRLIEFYYAPKRTYRGTIVGSSLSIQVPIADQTTSQTYLLQSGNYSTQRDELAGEWVQLTFSTPELTYAPPEYDTGKYEKTTPGGGGTGGGSGPDNGGPGSGSGSGTGTNIYNSDGTTLAGRGVTMAGDLTFSNSSATAGEAVVFSIDDGSNSSTIRAQATDGILLQATGTDDIEIEGITRFTDIITSASLGADQNDYAGFDGANVGRVTASTAVNITGLASGVNGRILAMHNVGSNPVTLVNASGSSTAANRFDIGEDYTVRASHGVLLQYDGTSSLWRIVAADRLGRFTEAYTTSTATTASLTATSPATNVGVAIAPKGTGAFMLQVPDGTTTGGNARGIRAIDLQTDRNNAAQVASGARSILIGGRRNTSSGADSVCIGSASTASGSYSIAMGGNGSTGATANAQEAVAIGVATTASGQNSFAVQSGTASAQNAVSFGGVTAALYGEFGHTSFSFLNFYQQTVTGLAATELFLDSGGTLRATLSSGEYWQFEIVVSAKVSVVGGGALSSGDVFVASYSGAIANKAGTTALIGTVDADMAAKGDASMADVVFTISADNTNDALKVEYTAGANSTGSTQTIVKASVKVFKF